MGHLLAAPGLNNTDNLKIGSLVVLRLKLGCYNSTRHSSLNLIYPMPPKILAIVKGVVIKIVVMGVTFNLDTQFF